MQPQEASEIKAFVVPKGQKCRYAAGHKKTGQPVTSVTDCNKKSNNKCKWNAAKGACKPGTPRMATDNNDGNDGSDGNAPAKNRAKKSRARADTSVEPVDCAAEINTEEGKMVVDIAGVDIGSIRASVQTAYY
eukprot:Stramenopile-MAST_4_protein_1100